MSRAIGNTHLRAVALAVLTLVSGCAGGGAPAGPTFAQVAAQIPTLATDRTRFIFYRDYELYESIGHPYVTLNSQVAGISEPGGVFYRDAPPNTYLISVRNSTFYPNQDKLVTAAAGQTVYVKIESIRSCNSGDSFYEPDTFVVVVVDAADGQRDVASKRYFASGS
jgi:predicted RNA-binding protein with TRAM domain